MCDEFPAVSSSTVGSNSCRMCFVSAERDLSLESVMDHTRRLNFVRLPFMCNFCDQRFMFIWYIRQGGILLLNS